MKKATLIFPVLASLFLMVSCSESNNQVCYRCSVQYDYNGQTVGTNDDYCYETDDTSATDVTEGHINSCLYAGGTWSIQE